MSTPCHHFDKPLACYCAKIRFMDMPTRLMERRIELGWAKKEAALRIGVSEQFIGQLESGEKKPSITTLGKICVAYKCTADWLIGLSNEPKQKSIPIPALTINETRIEYQADITQRMIWLLRDISEDKKRAILDVAKIIAELTN